MHTVNLGDMGTIPGYDLDNVCTCTDDAGPTCVGRTTQPGLYCDAPDGVDNQFAKIVQLIEIPLGEANFSSTAFSNNANAGDWTMLIEVDDYNGLKDDPAVTVSLYPCPGLGVTPKWDGTDSWAVLDTDVTSLGMPAYVSDGAYVSDQTLVATVPSVPITLAGDKQTISLTLSGAVLTGQLAETNGQWRLIQGTLAARIGLQGFFQSLSAYRDNMGNAALHRLGLPLLDRQDLGLQRRRHPPLRHRAVQRHLRRPLLRDGLHGRPGAARARGARADAHARLPAGDGPRQRLLRTVGDATSPGKDCPLFPREPAKLRKYSTAERSRR